MSSGVETGLFNSGWLLNSTYGGFLAIANWFYLVAAFLLRGIFGKLVGTNQNTWHHNESVYEEDEVQQKY